MYKVIIVDDEQIERQGIEFLIRQYGDLFETASVESSEEVLKRLETENYDILCTDIKMPFMDGLELSKHALDLQPKLKIIIFSAYGEFGYAKTAINLGVSDYVLKPVNIDEFQQVFDKILLELEEDETKRNYERDYLLLNLLNGILPDKLPFTNKSNMHIGYLKEYTRMLLIETSDNFFEISNEIIEKGLRENLTANFDYLNINQYQSILFLKNYRADQEEFVRLGEKIYDFLKEEYKTLCYIVLSREFNNYTQIPAEYAAFEEIQESRFFTGNTPVISYPLKQNASSEYMSDLISRIHYYATMKDTYSLRQCVLYFCRHYRYRQGFSKMYMNYIFSEMLKAISENLLSEYEFSREMQQILKCSSYEEIIEIMEKSIEKLEVKENEQQNNKITDTVIQYIHNNYQRDITLEELAKEVYLTPSYLSYIFRKKTGTTLVKFIKEYRMERAKEYLENTNMKIVDISKQIGYTNCSYFCQNFRSVYGISPAACRQISK
ncbi:two-component system, response regulator YesN [Anaerocolumna jejuensis DSM 15929]|uniref:Stage 0 sporulation protein A homolog n=1 Tax=Anaerocolumna jejuensis DSM 15929 TaxID=1121322 RepID=A0A1M6P1L5_9FIRM|nr:response regulator [Anaerocolumna jejuensis]SHK01897.1 two-component system, response regulator YesN [Anaerocolumna jejuensis DSM 15929]